ncbi:eomesodermin homolog [Ailuropoda melanoleuca]|uniref:eomesodermin homolog n=1 Tax=Ailuropoda melanoleuca TaxID=9646 RepID=UPI0014948149|nr:eomesodermin homolog [Ailuropoda melanoleuca]
MQLGEQLLVSSVNLPGAHFYPLESARGGGSGSAGHLPGAAPSPQRLDLDKAPKKFPGSLSCETGSGEPTAASAGAPAAMLSDADSGDAFASAAAVAKPGPPDGRKLPLRGRGAALSRRRRRRGRSRRRRRESQGCGAAKPLPGRTYIKQPMTACKFPSGQLDAHLGSREGQKG